MGPGPTPSPVQRTWTAEIRPGPGGPAVSCTHCGAVPISPGTAGARAAALAHLARHARHEPLAAHLRTCRCGEHSCSWHPRHRGCDGRVLLLLTRVAGGRRWRLADVCRACASWTAHAAEVPEPGVDEVRPLTPQGCIADQATATASAPSGPVVYRYDLADEGAWWVDGLVYD
jgi:hypothetical protein